MIVVLPIVMAVGISIAWFMLGMLGYLLFGFFKKLYHDLLHWHMPEDDLRLLSVSLLFAGNGR